MEKYDVDDEDPNFKHFAIRLSLESTAPPSQVSRWSRTLSEWHARSPCSTERKRSYLRFLQKRAELAFLAVISAFIGLLGIGTIRRWRWTFWLILVAFLFGVLRVPASGLEMAGVLPATGPTWYVLFQAVLGLVQFGIGLAMLASYRRAGVWGSRTDRC